MAAPTTGREPHPKAGKASGGQARHHQSATAAAGEAALVRAALFKGTSGGVEVYASIEPPVPALGYTG
eukprot:2594216-Alexandrium_andersonii.AAC.1